MRSIGKRNIKKLKEIVKTEMGRVPWPYYSYPSVEEIMRKVPLEWFDLWEGAYTEIERIIYSERLDTNPKM